MRAGEEAGTLRIWVALIGARKNTITHGSTDGLIRYLPELKWRGIHSVAKGVGGHVNTNGGDSKLEFALCPN